jgi:hypothetical protein
MEGGEGTELVEMGMGEREDHVDECERLYVVGELVEYWAGPVVRGYRTDSGAPAFVREVQGGGWYGIKMVESLRGRLRRVHWKSLFKDGTFTKQVARKSGARVMTGSRMMEKATIQAEQKFVDELRKSQRELNKAEKAMKDKDKDVEDRLKRQEIAFRTAHREREKADCIVFDKNKRQMEALGKDLEQDREEENRLTRHLIRELRSELKLKEEELKLTRQEEATLKDKLVMEQKKTKKQKTSGETWQARHRNLFENEAGKGERVIALEGEVKRKTRELSTLRKELETTCSMQDEEITRRNLEAQVPLASPCFISFTFVRSNFLLYFSKAHDKYRKKLEITLENEKKQRRAAEKEADVATGLVMVIHDQRKAAEKELEVRLWVWGPD